MNDDWLGERIRSVLNLAADLVAESSANSDTWSPKDPGSKVAGGGSIRPMEKMLSEAALLALLGHRALGNDPNVRCLLDAIEEHNDSLDWIYEQIRERPHLWATGGLVWIVLDHFSRADRDKRTRLRALWEQGVAQPTERYPFRLLDHAWVESLVVDKSNPVLDSEVYLSTTSLGNLKAGLLMAPRDLYAVTHCAMYLTDFGRRPSPRVTPGWIGPLALSRLLSADLDLSGELALSEALVSGAGVHIGALVSARSLGAVFDAIGCIPGPPLSTGDLRPNRPQGKSLNYQNYHPTFVYGIFCCVVAGKRGEASALGDLLASQFPDWSVELDIPSADTGALEDRIARRFDAWLPLLGTLDGARTEGELLRAIVDAYIIEAVNQNRAEDVLGLLGMSSVAGTSAVELAARQLLMARASLAGADNVSSAVSRLGMRN